VPTSKTPAAICSQVARILKEERMKRGLSMTSVAAKAGLSQQIVSFIERGTRNPTLDTLLRITGAMKVDLAKIISQATRSAKKK